MTTISENERMKVVRQCMYLRMTRDKDMREHAVVFSQHLDPKDEDYALADLLLMTKGVASPEIDESDVVHITLSESERSAVDRLTEEQGLSEQQLFRCALRQYQLDHERRKSGETVSWSGDVERGRAFAGTGYSYGVPFYTTSNVYVTSAPENGCSHSRWSFMTTTGKAQCIHCGHFRDMTTDELDLYSY